jgi:hypothetical protein
LFSIIVLSLPLPSSPQDFTPSERLIDKIKMPNVQMRLSGGSPSGTTGPPQHGAALTGQNVVLGGDKSEGIRKNMQKALKYFSLSGIWVQPAHTPFPAVPTHAYMLILYMYGI